MQDVKVEGSTPPSKPVASFKCVFDSPKYKNSTPPVPFANKFVSVSGMLTDIFFNNGNEDEGIQTFLLSVEHIVFMGSGPETVAITNKLDCEYLSLSYFSVSLTTGVAPASTPRRKGFGAKFKLASSSQPASPLGTSVASISSPSTSDMNTNGKRPRIDTKQAGPSARQLEKMRED